MSSFWNTAFQKYPWLSPKKNPPAPEVVVPQISPDKRKALLVREAEGWEGFTEQGGDNMGQAVQRFQKAVDGKAVGEPWCASFVWHCIKEVDGICNTLGDPKTTKLFASEHVMTMWRKAPGLNRVGIPEPGDLVLWQHGESERGHIGIVISDAELGNGKIITIEGNTGMGAGVQREGDGVYRRTRDMVGAGRMHVVGFLKVWP